MMIIPCTYVILTYPSSPTSFAFAMCSFPVPTNVRYDNYRLAQHANVIGTCRESGLLVSRLDGLVLGNPRPGRHWTVRPVSLASRRGIDSCVGHASPFLELSATCGIELNY